LTAGSGSTIAVGSTFFAFSAFAAFFGFSGLGFGPGLGFGSGLGLPPLAFGGSRTAVVSPFVASGGAWVGESEVAVFVLRAMIGSLSWGAGTGNLVGGQRQDRQATIARRLVRVGPILEHLAAVGHRRRLGREPQGTVRLPGHQASEPRIGHQADRIFVLDRV
jgi:hypothetical protein